MLSPQQSLLAGVNILLEGPTGTGKTYSLGTIADSGVELFLLFTESGLETALGYWTDRGLEVPKNVHWHVIDRPKGGFDLLIDGATKINQMTQESLHKMQDVNRAKNNHFIILLRALNDFEDQRTGTKYGPVDGWDNTRCLAIDSLTGINPLAMSLVVGNKPVKSQPDWGIAQDQIEKVIRQITDGCKCHFVLTAHVEREVDQVFGGIKITVSTLGRALAPKIPPMFSDVIMSVRDGTRFSWTTAAPNADLKARNLPIADGIPPSFAPIFSKWLSRAKAFQAVPGTEAK